MLAYTFALFGLIMGSFAGLLYARLPALYLQQPEPDWHPYPVLRALCQPASHCDHCQTRLPWWQNIPLVSFCYLRGRCAFCAAAIPSATWKFELAGLLVFVAVWAGLRTNDLALMTPFLALLSMGLWAMFILGLLLLWALDQRYFLLPDFLTLGLMWLALLLSVFQLNPWLTGQPTLMHPGSDPALAALLGAVLAYGSFWLIAAGFWLRRGIMGLGLGDAKLLAALGAWQGVYALPSIVLIACVCGLAGECSRRLWRRQQHRLKTSGQKAAPQAETLRALARAGLPEHAFAFGPYLIAAALVHAIISRW